MDWFRITTMRLGRHIFVISALLVFASYAVAGDVTYRAQLSGVECSGCKKSIVRSLGKIEGVKSIRITKAGKESHTLTVVAADSTNISKADAVKALGKNAPHYKIRSWSRIR